MKTDARSRTGTRRRESGERLRSAAFRVPPTGENVELFSDRMEDALEYELMMHDFASRHAAEIAEDSDS